MKRMLTEASNYTSAPLSFISEGANTAAQRETLTILYNTKPTCKIQQTWGKLSLLFKIVFSYFEKDSSGYSSFSSCNYFDKLGSDETEWYFVSKINKWRLQPSTIITMTYLLPLANHALKKHAVHKYNIQEDFP